MISFSFLKDIFSGCKILVDFFQYLKVVFNFLPVSMISDEKSAVILILSPTIVRCYFLYFLNFFFLSLVFRSLIIMCPGMDFFGFILFGVCSVEILRFALFTKFGKFSAIIASRTLSAQCSFYLLSLIPKI